MTLQEFYARFDPITSAGRFYVDCTAVRGNDLIGQSIFMAFAGSPGAYRHKLLTGHVGGGKTTELLKICDILKKKDFGKSFFPVYINMDEYMDTRDVDIRDILLGIVSEVSAAFRQQLGIELKDSYFTKRLEELRDTLLGNITVDKVEAAAGPIKASFKINSRSREYRDEVRQRVFVVPESLAEEVNLLLEEARIQLAKSKHGYDDFVLIVDGLDRVQAMRNGRNLPSDIASFFLDNASQLTSVRCHAIWTAPLVVVRRYGMELAMRYDGQPIVLPMIRTRFRNGQPCQAGLDAATEIITKRLEDFEPDSIITPEALAEIVKYSGGHMRMLIQLVLYAGENAGMVFPIELKHALRAANTIARTFVGAIREGDWQPLVDLELSQTKIWDVLNQDHTGLLEKLCVLEYVNGEGDEIGQAIQWYAVHPIVQELPKYKETLKQNSLTGS